MGSQSRLRNFSRTPSLVILQHIRCTGDVVSAVLGRVAVAGGSKPAAGTVANVLVAQHLACDALTGGRLMHDAVSFKPGSA